MRILYLITARGGSKGIPGKNIKLLNGIPLIVHTINAAREVTSDEHICVSTDDKSIAEIVKSVGLHVPFMRPAELASDTAGSDGVILHALEFYEQAQKFYDLIVLLQPTSPFRTALQIQEAIACFTGEEDMIQSVKETKSNPYTVLMEEDENSFLHKSKKLPNSVTRRQDAPKVYEANGAIYVINVASLKKYGSLGKFEKVKKYLMPEQSSLDLDTTLDWEFAEFLIATKN